MKKFLLAFTLLTSSLAFAQTTVYNGNGKTDFGGAVGTGTLNVSNTADSFGIYLNKGTGPFDSVLVFYIDTLSPAGINTTSQIITTIGTSDRYSRAAIAQGSGTNPTLSFPAGFTPDYAIAFDKVGGKVYSFQPVFGNTFAAYEGTTFTITPVNNRYGKTFSKTELGLVPGQNIRFNFIGTYIDGTTVSRSAEGFGDPFTGYNGTARVGSTAPYTITSFFNYNSATALPLVLTDFKAATIQDKVLVNWTVTQETNMDGYEIERSANGVQFSTIATLGAKNNSSVSSVYSFTDNTPLQGLNYYRLVMKEKGRKELSSIISVKSNNVRRNIKVQQLGKSLSIQLNNVPAGSYKLSIINSNGQILQSATLQHDGSNLNRQVDITKSITKGIYRITLQSDKESLIESVFLQ